MDKVPPGRHLQQYPSKKQFGIPCHHWRRCPAKTVSKKINSKLCVAGKKVDALLKNTLPETVAEELKLQGHFQPRPYNCTILFTDFVEFTALSEVMEESVLVETLNTIFTEFDINTNKFKGTKLNHWGCIHGNLRCPRTLRKSCHKSHQSGLCNAELHRNV